MANRLEGHGRDADGERHPGLVVYDRTRSLI
jgi:hypothetical protein